MSSDSAKTGTRWQVNATLFAATLVTVFWAGHSMVALYGGVDAATLSPLAGWVFAVPLMGIWVAHEFGHWLAARLHGVPASLPYFIPWFVVPPALGTMGAIISMPERIRSRNALLDIGAAGPLAGLTIAVPVLCLGLSLSEIEPLQPGMIQEGQSLLYLAMKRVILGEIAPGHDVLLHPTAYAGWAGLFLTMINLLPWGQLDGGHIAYALMGEKHHLLAQWVRWGLLALFAYNLWTFLPEALRYGGIDQWLLAFQNSAFWLVWFAILSGMGQYFGTKHPPVDQGQLTPMRRAVAVGTFVCFLVLFMPTPLSQKPTEPSGSTAYAGQVSQPSQRVLRRRSEPCFAATAADSMTSGSLTPFFEPVTR